MRAADVVVTKPGYGIIAECLANDTALLYTVRGHFIEYDVLVAAMPRFLRVPTSITTISSPADGRHISTRCWRSRRRPNDRRPTAPWSPPTCSCA